MTAAAKAHVAAEEAAASAAAASAKAAAERDASAAAAAELVGSAMVAGSVEQLVASLWQARAVVASKDLPGGGGSRTGKVISVGSDGLIKMEWLGGQATATRFGYVKPQELRPPTSEESKSVGY